MDNLCRTCMSTTVNSAISVYSETEMNDTVAGLLNVYCSLEITPDDQLPKLICPTCVEELQIVINFRRQCDQTDQNLRQMLLVEQEQEAAAVIYFEPIEVDSKPELVDELPETEVLQEEEEEEPEENEILIDQPYSVVETMSFRCCLCEEVFHNEDEYRGHLRQIHGTDGDEAVVTGGELRCVICMMAFEREEELELHRGKQFMEVYKCNNCENIYESIAQVTQHFGEVHEANDDQEQVEPEMEEQIVVEVPTKKMKFETNCSERYCCVTHCHEVFSGEQELIAHAQEKHEIKLNHNKSKNEPDKPFVCVVCFRSFGSYRNLKVHQFIRANHNQGKHFTCEHCPFRAVSAALLTVHERSKHSGERPFGCPHCEKRFFSQLHLKNHLVCHSSARPFSCSYCDRSFSRKRNMEEHIRSCHSEDKPFRCEQCPAAFKVPQHLKIHTRIHSGEKPYQCHYCDNSYYHSSDRKRHEMTHTGQRPYRCSTCNAGFTRKRTLTIHERTHTGLRPFRCAICLTGFCQSSTYKKHMERHGTEAAGEGQEVEEVLLEEEEVEEEGTESDGEGGVLQEI